MNDFFNNKLSLLKFILLSIAFGSFFVSEGYATTKSVAITQQEKTVKGKVTDDNDEPLIGVSVRVAGTSAGTVTDSDGMFQLNVAGSDVLEFSYVGYKTVKVTVGNKPFLSVILRLLWWDMGLNVKGVLLRQLLLLVQKISPVLLLRLFLEHWLVK